MDSIERMRRLNELTKELKQHGFAESSFEAIQQANQIYGEDDLTHDVKHGIIRGSDDKKNNSDNTDTNTSGEIMDQQTSKKVDQLSANIDTLTGKMNEIIKAINDIDARIKELKNRPTERVVEKFVERPVEKTTHTEESRSETKSESTPETHTEKPKDEYAMNQRTGNFQSNDVAIDKMFYYGNKNK